MDKNEEKEVWINNKGTKDWERKRGDKYKWGKEVWVNNKGREVE